MKKQQLSELLSKGKEIFFHFTRSETISLIEEEGLVSGLSNRENAVAGDYSHPAIYFSVGCKGALETVDLWIRWEYDRLAQQENIPHAIKGINLTLLKKVYDKIYNDFRDRKYLSLDLKEGNNPEDSDFSLSGIDFKKENDIVTGITKMKQWFYGPYTNLESPIMDAYNMSTHEGVNISPDNITLITDNKEREDALSVLIEMYDRSNTTEMGIFDLDKFVLYAKQRTKMEEILKLAKEKQIEKIIEHIKNEQTNEARKDMIIQLPDDIKIELINRIEDIYIVPELKNTNGINVMSRTDLIDDTYVYSIIASLSEDNMLNFLKNKDDRFKVNFVTDIKPNDYIKLSLINMISDFPYKLLIAHRINNAELRNKIMLEIGVSNTFINMREGAYELYNADEQKYNLIKISKELSLGIEIEGANINYAEILKQIANLPGELSLWKWKGDYTIAEGNQADNGINYGLEVISPILSDSPETVQQIYTVCNMLQELGTEINSRCGGHIHFGIDYFKRPKELWNLIEIYGNCEEIFNLISNEPGTLPRDSLNRFAKSTYKKLLEANIDVNNFNDINEFIEEIKRIQYGKEYDVNISNHNTVEFRSPNGSTKPYIWIENIKLFGKLMEMPKALEDDKIPNIDKKRKLFEQIKLEKDESQKCDLLLELLFDDENERKIYRERFDVNKSLQFNMEDFREIYIANENNLNEREESATREEK